jgi:Flp pilus assembly protein TadD
MARKSAFVLVLALAAGLCRCRPPVRPTEIGLGVAASESGRWDEAVTLWMKAVAADPSSAAAHNNLAVAYEQGGRSEDARKEYETALKLDPGNTYIRENLRRFTENRETAAKRKAGQKTAAKAP